MTQQNLFPEERHNTGLFSQYYLDEILLPTFGKTENGSRAADLGLNYFDHKFDELEPIILKNEEIAARRNERQLEEDVIKPILDLLGHYYDVAPHAKGDVPDYILFPSEENKNEAKKLKPASDEYQKLNVGILDAKAWKESRKVGVMDEANISQIFRYLINFRRRWGVLTDGFRWILFANKQGIRQDQYIEFNLRDIIRSKDRGQNPNFRLFVFLFRREAFSRVPGSDALLDKILDESAHNAEKLQSDLKKKVYDAFGIVAEDFRSQKRLPLATPQEIADLKEYSLIVLYRILFLLFGESRLILPIRPETNPYYNHSLERIIEMMEDDPKPQAHGSKYWALLSELFGIIHGLEDDGSPSRLGEDIGLPAYNGGLFDPNNYKKFASWKLGDKALKEVIDLLAYTGEKQKSNAAKRVRVSYRDLGVQHLGNIYEGILENHLKVASDGTIEVVTDKNERKATGSYYTPDYIVDYIVNETLGPLVRGAKSQEELLRINVLDPAMGSGHFLIGAIDYLAKELLQKDHKDLKYTESDLQDARRTVAERCIYGVDLNPMAVELAKLSIWLHTISSQKPLTFLDNHIKCGNSLIGAWIKDLNVLPDKSKKQAKEKKDKAEQNLFPDHKLTQEASQWLAEGRLYKEPSNDIGEVKAKEKLEKELDEHRSKYRHLFDLWTAAYFLDAPLSEIDILFRRLSGAIAVNADEAPLPNSELLYQALQIAKEKRFFHWELEFPEIFFDKHGRRIAHDAGFDAVIGNPPYVRGETLGTVKEKYFKPTYEVYTSSSDIYVYFYELANKNLRKGGRLGFITSNKFIRTTYGKPLRKFLTEKMSLSRIVDFGELRVFEEAAAMPVIVEASKNQTKTQQFLFAQIKTLKFENLEEIVEAIGEHLDEAALEGENWSLSSMSGVRIFRNMKINSQLLGEYSGHKINYGIKTAFNEAFIIDRDKKEELMRQDSRSAEIIKPFVVGDDIRNYHINFEERYLIWTYIGVSIESYPAIFEHLKQYLRPADDHDPKHKFIEERQDQGEHWWELRPCSYYDEFLKPKIVYPEIAKESRFTLDRDQYLTNKTCFILPLEDPFLLAVLNSSLIWFALCKICPSLGDPAEGGRLNLQTVYLETLPIRKISFSTPPKELEKLTNKLISESELVLNSNETDEQIKQKLQPTLSLAKQYSVDKNDVLHDFLSHLAEQMLVMNKEKQKLTADFFMWMENYNIPPRSELKPKTFFDEFWKKEFKHILAHLKRNKVAIGRQSEDSLLERFNTSSVALLSLDKKIALTDWLIDQMVYALYGLTEEEIAIVEGT